MKTKKTAILLVAFTTLLNATAQIFFKLGVDKISSLNIFLLLTNYILISGFILYGISAILLILALKNGELSILYPLIALTFVWVALLSNHFLPGDFMNFEKWTGILMIVAGVSFIGVGSK